MFLLFFLDPGTSLFVFATDLSLWLLDAPTEHTLTTRMLWLELKIQATSSSLRCWPVQPLAVSDLTVYKRLDTPEPQPGL